MKRTAPNGLEVRYRKALRNHLSKGERSHGPLLQGVGQAALSAGLVTLDLARMHEKAMLALAGSYDFTDADNGSLRQAGRFFAEALLPIEAANHAIRHANAELHRRNRVLNLHAIASIKAKRRLEKEISRRIAGETIVRKGQQKYRDLFRKSELMRKKLRQLTRNIISAQEDERKEISRELHDEVVQTLVGINVELSALSKGTSDGLSNLRSKIARTQRLVENSVKAVHRFARELRPAVLDDLGLIPALHAYSKNLAERRKLRIRITAFGGVEDLESAKRTVLFRVAQEALNNVVRHAEATHVRLSITELPGAIRMEINDDGKSFSVAKTLFSRNPSRLGLIGMQERIEMVGGTLVIESAPGAGTTVRAEVPFGPGKPTK